MMGPAGDVVLIAVHGGTKLIYITASTTMPVQRREEITFPIIRMADVTMPGIMKRDKQYWKPKSERNFGRRSKT